MTLIATAARDSPLARRNPTIKLALLFAASVALLFILDPVTPTVVYQLGILGVVIGGRVPVRTVVVAQLPFLAFAFGVFSINVLSRPGTVLWQEGPLRVTVEGLVVGAALAARTLAIGILSIGFVLTTDSLGLMTSLNQNARLGARPSYALMAGYRLLQQLPGEWTAIRNAQAVRAPLRRDGTVRRGPASFGRAAFALLVLAIRRGERIAQSLESRGLGLEPRTVWHPVRVDTTDIVFAGVIMAAFAGLIVASAATGVLDGPGTLF
jgi:energy-coupling factor transport system permease protein